MMNEEEYIRNKMGNKCSFRVPDGYFEQLTARVMSQLPEERAQQKPALVKRLRPLLYAAACICIAVFSVAIYFNHKDAEQQQVAAINAPQQDVYYTDTYIDEAADYAMLDNEEIYYSLLADI
jgi:hypothetical protein